MIKIAVMAGTPADTAMGKTLLIQHHFKVSQTIAISETPEAQTFFQTMSTLEQDKVMSQYFEQLKRANINILFVYCNSLSAAVDFNKWAIEYDIIIITPLDVYRQLAKDYQHLVLLTANAQGAAGIERVMTQYQPTLLLMTVSMLSLVKDIEHQEPLDKIIQRRQLVKLFDFINASQPQGIIIGCTHFPYILSAITPLTTLPIINPATQMIALLQSYVDEM